MGEQPTLHLADKQALFIAYCHRVSQDAAQSSVRAKFHVKQLLRFLREGQHDHN